jgi:RepB DNA-primase from phage plasmid
MSGLPTKSARPQPTNGSVADGYGEVQIVDAALEFLLAFAQDGAGVTFQTFDDSNRKDKSLTRIIHAPIVTAASLRPLIELSNRGAGIFFTVNRTDLKGRTAANVTGIRAVFADLDGAPLESILTGPLLPSITVESSPGRYHAYWLTDDVLLEDFKYIQKSIIVRFGSDPAIHDRPRVMRLPGFAHQKKEPFISYVFEFHLERRYTRAQLLEAFPPILIERTAPRPAQRTQRTCAELSQNGLDAYVQRALKNETNRVRSAVKGTMQTTLYSAAAALFSLVSAGALDATTARNSLEDAGEAIALTAAQIASNIANGAKAGMATPRDLSKINTAEVAKPKTLRSRLYAQYRRVA